MHRLGDPMTRTRGSGTITFFWRSVGLLVVLRVGRCVIMCAARWGLPAAFLPREQEISAMTTVNPPVIEFPFPPSPRPFEPAPEMLELSRQATVLRTILPGEVTGWLITGYEQVREVLVDPRFSRALLARPEQERRGIEVVS